MMDAKILTASEVEAIENSAIRASGHVVGIRARRLDQTNFAQTTKKTTFFQKNTLKILLFAKFAVPLHRVTNIT